MIIADKKKWIRGFVLGITIPLGTVISNLFRDNPLLMAVSFVITTTVPMFLILTLTKNMGFEFPDLEELDAMDTASKLEVLENTIVEASQMLGQYTPIDMRFTNDIKDLTGCGCDAVCSCETDFYIEALDDEEVNRENGFFNTRIELEKKEAKKETKRSDVVELE